MSDYNEYMRAYRAKNRDRINARQRERRKGSKPKNVKVELKVVDGISGIPENEAKKLDGIFFEPKLSKIAKDVVKAVVKMENDHCKCCVCHLPGKHFARNRWFCDAHRP